MCIKSITVGLLILSTLSACSPKNPPLGSTSLAPSRLQQQLKAQALNTDTLSRYYPMTPGLQWTYALTQSQDDQDNTRFKTMTITAEAETLPTAIILRRSYPDSNIQPRPSLARQLEDRILLSHYEGSLMSSFNDIEQNASPTTGFITALQAPLTIGKSWPGRAFTGGTETISVAGVETLNLPAGKFEALRIEHQLRYDNGREDVLRYWYAPEVGLVKMYEEISFHTDRWVKFKSTGVLQRFQKP